MGVTFGFYNSKDGDRKYDAIQMSSIFDGIVVDGVLMHVDERLMVSADGESMTIKVAPGRAWFNHTWTLNDSILPLEVPQAEMILDRIDAVVIDVDSRVEVRENSIKLIKGVGSTNPQRPALINEADHHQYPLAYIHVGQMVTSLRPADVTNMVGTSACPFCTAPLEKMDIDALIAQWGDQWNRYYETKTTEMNQQQQTWNTDIQNYFDGKKAEIQQWQIDTFNDFNTWFESIQGLVDEDVAVKLSAAVLELQGKIDELTSQQSALLQGLKDELTSGAITVKLAQQAESANTANSAQNAAHASSADHATSAGHANSSDYAATAGVANSVAWGNVTGKPSSYIPSYHLHPANQITAGTLIATVLASYGEDYGTSRLRNMRFSTTDLSPGVSALNNGEVYGVYE